jgi:hypothetical protein
MQYAAIILQLLSEAPQAYAQIKALYEALKADISETDQAKIDQALADAQKSDDAATAQADADLDAASKT